jgi:pyridoxamine 5'-phosphate oxidase
MNNEIPEFQKMPEGVLSLPNDPFEALRVWISEATAAGALEPTAMTLATASKNGVPTARIVLFKGSSLNSAGREGVEFFTNYESVKSSNLNENANAALVFYWNLMRRQVRIEGVVEKLSAEESDKYFQSRARESRIGAWSSSQSRYIQSREELIDKVKETETRFGNETIPCPPFWGGWRLTPSRFEFWEERPSRLHERFELKLENGAWIKRRLAP